ncbi:MAG: ATP-binding protein [Nevskia sp.]|nr:ATP-binding protein [Nevskia sp.]
MKLRWLLPAMLAGVAIGVLLFLARMTQSADSKLHLERLANLRAINNLDVQLNRVLTQARVATLMAEGDERVRITRQLGDALDAIDKGPQSLHGLDPALDLATNRFLDTIQDKFELDFDIEARTTVLNQRLVNSANSVPGQVAALVAAATPEVRDNVGDLGEQLKTQIVTFSVTPSPSNQKDVEMLLDRLAGQPAAFKDALQRLHAGCADVIVDKDELVDRLRDFLDRPTGPQLQAVEQAYSAWYAGQQAIVARYRLALAVYAASLLLVLGWLGLRLRGSYRALDRANADLLRANSTLEAQVETRTHDLSAALRDLRDSQAQLVQSEKMASLGQLVAGVAHEINTPLGYARSNAEIVRDSLGRLGELCAAQDRALRLLTAPDSSDEAVAAALAQAEARRGSDDPAELMADLHSLLQDADHGLNQIAELVSSLKDFSRVDRSRTDLFDLNDGIDSALKICQNQLKHRVEVVKQYGTLPQIECSPSQLNQVFLNLFTNAAQAIEGNGRIYVHTLAADGGVAVRVLDTGCGMSEDVRSRVFEPFFTTKPVGKGTGLGLSIVYRIVAEHGGRIEVRSSPGKGSEFALWLPARQARAAPAEPTVEAALTAVAA